MLEELASSISAHEATLAQLTGSERALKYRLTLHTGLIWVVYAGFWYMNVLGRAKYLAAPLVLLPALCVRDLYSTSVTISVLFWRRAIGWWYHRQEHREGASEIDRAAQELCCAMLTSLHRSDAQDASQEATRRARSAQEEDQVRRDAIAARALRREDSSKGAAARPSSPDAPV